VASDNFSFNSSISFERSVFSPFNPSIIFSNPSIFSSYSLHFSYSIVYFSFLHISILGRFCLSFLTQLSYFVSLPHISPSDSHKIESAHYSPLPIFPSLISSSQFSLLYSLYSLRLAPLLLSVMPRFYSFVKLFILNPLYFSLRAAICLSLLTISSSCFFRDSTTASLFPVFSYLNEFITFSLPKNYNRIESFKEFLSRLDINL